MPIFDDLDGRLYKAEAITAAPKHYINNLFVGSLNLLEELAIDIQRLSTGQSDPLERAPDEYNASSAVRDNIASKYNGLSGFLIHQLTKHYKSLQNINESIGIFETYLAFAELAMNPAILPGQLHLWKRKPTWFDVQPGYRFYNLCYATHRFGGCPKLGKNPEEWSDQLIHYIEHAATYMEWPSYRESIKVLCELEIPEFDLLSMGHGTAGVKRLAEMKLENLVSYLFGQVGLNKLEPECLPLAIIGPVFYINIHYEDKIGIRLLPSLISLLLNEFYFSNSLEFTAGILSVCGRKQCTQYASMLEDITAIEGVGEALLKQARTIRKNSKRH